MAIEECLTFGLEGGRGMVADSKAYSRRTLDLLSLSTSLLWWQAVAGIIGVTSSHALRSNSRCTWRHGEGARNGDNTAIHRALSTLRPRRCTDPVRSRRPCLSVANASNADALRAAVGSD